MSFSVEALAKIAIDLQSDLVPCRPFFAFDYHPAADTRLRCFGAAALRGAPVCAAGD